MFLVFLNVIYITERCVLTLYWLINSKLGLIFVYKPDRNAELVGDTAKISILHRYFHQMAQHG